MTRDEFNTVLERVESGELRADRELYERIPDFWWRLRMQEAERDDLHRLTPQQRLRRYRAGELTRYQLSVWENNYPHEIPRVNGYSVWFAATLCDIVDEGKG